MSAPSFRSGLNPATGFRRRLLWDRDLLHVWMWFSAPAGGYSRVPACPTPTKEDTVFMLCFIWMNLSALVGSFWVEMTEFVL